MLPAVCGGLLSCYMLYLFFEEGSNNKEVGNNQFISRSVLASSYGIAFMLYMSLLAEQWKKHSNDLCFKWGTTNSTFQGELPSNSPIHLAVSFCCNSVIFPR